MDDRILHIPIVAAVMLALTGCQHPAGNSFASAPMQSVGPIALTTMAEELPEIVQAAQPAKSPAAAEPLAKVSRITAQWDDNNGSGTVAPDAQVLNAMNSLTAPRKGTSWLDGAIKDSSGPFIQVAAAQVNGDSSSLPLVAPAVVAPATYPVDLPTILRLAGGRNWAVQLAGERINEAQANVTAAEALWLPNLNIGIGATKHEGQIQNTSGQVIDVSRNALFVGGGAKVANAPLTGGAGGPARLAVDLSIADALFQPLVARQLSRAAESRQTVAFNDAQLAGALAYFDLVAAQGEVAIGSKNLSDARDLYDMTGAFVAAGKASPAEVARVQVIVANQHQALVEAKLKLKLASIELIRVARLDPTQLSNESLLYSADDHLLAIELIPETANLDSLIAQGQLARPEVVEQHSLAQARLANARGEELRPYIPNLNLGLSLGGFGGGPGSNIDNFSGRSDFDAQLVWEVRNLGFGENAARCKTCSQYRQAVLSSHQMQDQIAAEIRNAWHRVSAGRQRINISRGNVSQAAQVLQQNLDRIRGLEGQPLENIQALNAVSNSRLIYLGSIVDYNKAQVELLRAVGRPVANGL